MTKPLSPSQADWEAIKALLPANLPELARAHGLSFEGAPGFEAKIHNVYDLLRLIFMYVGLNGSLDSTAHLADGGGIVSLTPQAFHQRFIESGPLMAAVLAFFLHLPDRPPCFVVGGLELSFVDATCVQRPGALGTTARVHYQLAAPNLYPVDLKVTDDSEGETFKHFVFGPNKLVVGDRGYCNPPGIGSVLEEGSHVLVRYNTGTLPLFDRDGEPFELMKHLQMLKKPEQRGEWAVQVEVGERRKKERTGAPNQRRWQRGRVMALRLSSEAAERQRAKLRKEKGAQVTREELALANYLVLVTTASKRRLSTSQLLEIFRLRWQAELLIKRDKSQGGLDQLPVRRPAAIRTWLLTKMVLSLLKLRQAGLEPGEEFWEAMTDQPWRMGLLLEAVLRSALIPVRLTDLPPAMKIIAGRMTRTARQNHRRDFRKRFRRPKALPA